MATTGVITLGDRVAGVLIEHGMLKVQDHNQALVAGIIQIILIRLHVILGIYIRKLQIVVAKVMSIKEIVDLLRSAVCLSEVVNILGTHKMEAAVLLTSSQLAEKMDALLDFNCKMVLLYGKRAIAHHSFIKATAIAVTQQ